jgi:hypothetical protein
MKITDYINIMTTGRPNSTTATNNIMDLSCRAVENVRGDMRNWFMAQFGCFVRYDVVDITALTNARLPYCCNCRQRISYKLYR